MTLFAAPIASAQSPEAAPPLAGPTNTALLSPAAFARLLQPPPDVAPARLVKNTPRLDLLYRGTTSMARQAQAVSTPAAQQKSWVSRHKTALIVWSAIGAVGFFSVHHCLDVGKCGDW